MRQNHLTKLPLRTRRSKQRKGRDRRRRLAKDERRSKIAVPRQKNGLHLPSIQPPTRIELNRERRAATTPSRNVGDRCKGRCSGRTQNGRARRMAITQTHGTEWRPTATCYDSKSARQ